MKDNVRFDFITNTITVNKGYYKEACKPGTKENIEFLQLQRDYPNMRIALRSVRSGSRTSDTKGITYKYMRRFIAVMDEENLITFEKTISHFEKHSENKLDPIRSKFGKIEKEEVSLEDKTADLRKYAMEHKNFSFKKLLENQSSKIQIIVTFLSILELMKMGFIQISQEKLFDDIKIISKIFGKSEEELDEQMKEKRMRIDDALAATKAAVQEGIVVGGGCALLSIIPALKKDADKLEGDEKTGAYIIIKALEEPIRQIAANAGVDGGVVINEILRNNTKNYGYNALTNEYCDMLKAGIVDPTMVTRSALQNAASVASTLLTTEVLVADIKEPAPAMPPQMGGDMY